LLQRFRQVPRACLHLVEQPRILDCDHRLVGEVLHQLDLLAGERPDLLAVDADHPDQLALLEHRHRNEGAGTAEVHGRDAHRVAGRVRRLGFAVVEVNHLFRSSYSADRGVWAGTNEWILSAFARICYWDAVQRNRAETVALAQPQDTELGFAKAGSLRQYGLQYRLEVARRARDDLEHLRGRRLLLQRLGQLLFQLGAGFEHGVDARPRLRPVGTRTGTAGSLLHPLASQASPRRRTR
jgi:hypothetical protein